jgi:hypothetical protein
LWFPFWPFEPYLSLFIIGLGTMLATTARVFGEVPDARSDQPELLQA